MKKWLTFLLSLSSFNLYFLSNAFADTNDLRLRVQSLVREIKKEGYSLRTLRTKYEFILKEKQGFKNLIEQQRQQVKLSAEKSALEKKRRLNLELERVDQQAAKQRLLEEENKCTAQEEKQRLGQEKAKQALINKELEAWQQKHPE